MNDFLPFFRPVIGDEEIRAVENVLRSSWITTVLQNHQLEEDFRHKFGCRHAIAFCSATAGMHILNKLQDARQDRERGLLFVSSAG